MTWQNARPEMKYESIVRSEEIPATFVRYAADTLGDTAGGLSSSQIVSITADHAVDANARLPHLSVPFSKPGINKRTALFENLMAFRSPRPLYKVIKDMCERPAFSDGHKAAVRALKLKLVSKYGHLDDADVGAVVNEALIGATRHWLEGYPEALNLFSAALEKQQHRLFSRNLLDDLRLGLEELLQQLFSNEKSLENQAALLGAFLKTKGGSPELTNMFIKLVDYYGKYQNTYLKHNDAVIEEEIELVFEITAAFIKHLIRINLR